MADGPLLRVRTAAEEYIAVRDDRDARKTGRAGRSSSRRLSRHVLGQPARGAEAAIAASPLADVALHALTESDLMSWRTSLAASLKATTRKRLTNDLRAALNTAYAKYRSRLDAGLPSIIKHGLKPMPADDDAASPARDNQILTDAKVRALIKAAMEVDAEQEWSGDLYRMVLVLAATGARFSQVARLKVGDVQRDHGRLMVPASRKGRGKSGLIAVQVGADVLDALQPAVTGRAPDEILLERWHHAQLPASIKYQRVERRPWRTATEIDRPWRAIRDRAEAHGTIPYSLRHPSIVRGIRSNLPIRLVAAIHDTSAAMIEAHYSKWIASGLAELPRGPWSRLLRIIGRRGGPARG